MIFEAKSNLERIWFKQSILFLAGSAPCFFEKENASAHINIFSKHV